METKYNDNYPYKNKKVKESFMNNIHREVETETETVHAQSYQWPSGVGQDKM